MRSLFASLLALFVAIPAWAGLWEISATGSYRKTNFDATHNAVMESATGSLGYYFWESSAIMASYTRGAAKQVQPEYTAYQTYEAYGLDLQMTAGERNSPFRPYIKGGAAYVVKDLRTYVPIPGSNPTSYQTIIVKTYGVTPTAGVGFKLMLGQQFAIKMGAEGSITPSGGSNSNSSETTYDLSLSAGISFLF
ncbi:MAG: outer membrane beta-barrel protein [Oligoflexia bacterium]|nr:outer membrane beta-barrel protein [Oligoflexia bacterium]